MIVIIDNIRSMHNVGSIFRTCDAFKIEKIYLCGITAKPPHREIEKTALGATKSVYWEHFTETIKAIEEIRKDNYVICAVEQHANSVALQNFSFLGSDQYALIFGNEVNGVSQDILSVSDYIIEIPHIGLKQSFNVSVAAGIVMWHIFHKRNLKH